MSKTPPYNVRNMQHFKTKWAPRTEMQHNTLLYYFIIYYYFIKNNV